MSERMAYNDGFDAGYEKAKKRIDELETSLAQARADVEALLRATSQRIIVTPGTLYIPRHSYDKPENRVGNHTAENYSIVRVVDETLIPEHLRGAS